MIMRNKYNLNIETLKVVELRKKDCLFINGGGRLSYAFSFITSFFGEVARNYSETEEGYAVQQALHDFH